MGTVGLELVASDGTYPSIHGSSAGAAHTRRNEDAWAMSAALTSAPVTLGTTAVELTTGLVSSGRSWLVVDNSAGITTAYVGKSTVAASTGGGLPVQAGEVLWIPTSTLSTAKWYGIIASGTMAIGVLEV